MLLNVLVMLKPPISCLIRLLNRNPSGYKQLSGFGDKAFFIVKSSIFVFLLLEKANFWFDSKSSH